MTDEYTTDATDAETTSACTCCGRLVHEGAGWLLRGEDELAYYRYRWSEGHEAAFSMAVAGTENGHMRQGFVTVSCRHMDGELSFSVIEPDDSHWVDSENFGQVLSREEALDANGLYPDLWYIVDAIVDHEKRLSERVNALHGA